MTNEILITKRDGTKVPLDLEKLHKVIFHACEGITGVSPSQVELNSSISFYEGITSSEIQETMIKSAADLISEETPNYQLVAGRLISYHLRKVAFNQFEPPALIEVVKQNVAHRMYEPKLLEWFTEEEYATLDSWIDHDRDSTFTYAAMEQFRGKYLVL